MANKTQPTPKDVQEFIDSISDEKRRDDSFALLKIMQEATGMAPVMWGTAIVGFGSLHYKYESGREGDTMVVGFSPRKAALVLYSVVAYDQEDNLLTKLGPHTVGKGCLYIKDLSKVDRQVLRQMIATAFGQRLQQGV